MYLKVRLKISEGWKNHTVGIQFSGHCFFHFAELAAEAARFLSAHSEIG
jgi:hypothetical protein